MGFEAIVKQPKDFHLNLRKPEAATQRFSQKKVF